MWQLWKHCGQCNTCKQEQDPGYQRASSNNWKIQEAEATMNSQATNIPHACSCCYTQALSMLVFQPGTNGDHLCQTQEFIHFCTHYEQQFLNPSPRTVCYHITFLTSHLPRVWETTFLGSGSYTSNWTCPWYHWIVFSSDVCLGQPWYHGQQSVGFSTSLCLHWDPEAKQLCAQISLCLWPITTPSHCQASLGIM